MHEPLLVVRVLHFDAVNTDFRDAGIGRLLARDFLINFFERTVRCRLLKRERFFGLHVPSELGFTD